MRYKKGKYYLYQNLKDVHIFKYICCRYIKDSKIKYHICRIIKYSNYPKFSGKIDSFTDNSIIANNAKEISEKEAFFWAL